MANQEQVALLRRGSEAWNTWRRQRPGIQPDLHEAYLANANLSRAYLINADLREANLSRTNLTNADLRDADMRNANMVSADLRNADLRGADLSFADLRGADLRGADRASTDLTSAYLTGTRLDPSGTKTTQRISTESADTSIASSRYSSGSSRSQERPRYSIKAKVPFWITLGVIVLLTLGFFVTLVYYLQFLEPHAQNGQPLDIVGTRGETITFTLQADNSLNGLWASQNGLSLTLQGTPGTIPVIPPKPISWGDTISTDSTQTGGEAITTQGAFTIPPTLGGQKEQVVSGSITGDISYPTPGLLYENTTVNIMIPLRLHLIAAGDLPRVSGQIWLFILGGLDVIMLGYFVLSLSSHLTVTRPEPGRPRWLASGHLPKKRFLTALAALVLIVGSLDALAFVSANQIAMSDIQANTTAYFEQSHHLTATVATQNALAATQNALAATSEAQAQVTAHVQATATASAIAALNPDPSFQTLALQDPLTSNTGDWDEGSLIGSCAFKADGFHLSSPDSSFSPFCQLHNHTFTDFVYLVHMKILQGNCGGLLFRENASSHGYVMSVCQDGTYQIPNQARGTSSAINQGLEQVNIVAVALHGSSMDLFINSQPVASTTGITIPSGGIGMEGVYGGEVVYSDLFVWTP